MCWKTKLNKYDMMFIVSVFLHERFPVLENIPKRPREAWIPHSKLIITKARGKTCSNIRYEHSTKHVPHSVYNNTGYFAYSFRLHHRDCVFCTTKDGNGERIDFEFKLFAWLPKFNYKLKSPQNLLMWFSIFKTKNEKKKKLWKEQNFHA